MAARLAPDLEPIPGYRLMERLGRGGFGEVWKVQAPGGMFKAMKFVYGNLDEATENGRPAEQELKALNRVKTIRHPYILSLERYDIVEGQLIIVMELADRNLFDRFRECQSQGLVGIPRNELLNYLEETAEALDLMNSQFQLQHLDIKPQNLFLVFNHVKVADFGLAKDLEGMQATLTGGVTPVYAAPETFECRVTRFCDQYSLGIVYQELLTGRRPFDGTTARQLMMQHIQSTPDLSPLPAHDRLILARALAKKPDQRFPSCSEMIQALRAAGDSPDRPLVVEKQANRTSSPVRRDGPEPRPTVKPPANPLPQLGGSIKLPPLVSQRGLAHAASAVNARPAPPEQTGSGVLFPALIVAVGQIGLIALQRLRRTLRDRFGSPSLPHVRMLYIDTDNEALQSMSKSSTAPDPSETIIARLNRPTHYKPREDLIDPGAWMQPNVLFRLPRQGETGGVRAFGRLALCDYYRTISAKMRAELEACTRSEALAEGAAATGLALRTNRPRVFVLTSLMGGTGSGMFLDLAYIARHQLRSLGYSQPEVHGVLYAPTVNATMARSTAVANSYAALTELLHYSSANTNYEFTFDSREGAISDRVRPFHRCLLLQLPNSTETGELRPALGMGAGFLFQELFTPIGREADKVRGETTRPDGAPSPIQTFGSFRLTWPRKGLLDRAARLFVHRLLESWLTRNTDELVEPTRGWLAEQWHVRQFDPDSLMVRLREGDSTQSRLIQRIDACLTPLDERLRSSDPEFSELIGAYERIKREVGVPEVDGQERATGAIAQQLEQSGRALALDAQRLCVEMATSFVDTPAYRIAGAEELIRQLVIKLSHLLESEESIVSVQQHDVANLHSELVLQLSSFETMSRGSRKIAAARDWVSRLRQFSQRRGELLVRRTMVNVYRSMAGFAPDFLREVQLCRQRIEPILARTLDRRRLNDSHGYLGPDRPLLPAGCQSVDDAARRLASEVTPEHVIDLDAAIQARIRDKFTSLFAFCQDKNDQSKAMAEIMLTQARELLEPRLVIANSVTCFFDSQPEEQAVRREIVQAYEEALPMLSGDRIRTDNQLCILLVPDDASGVRFGAMAQETLPDARLMTVYGSRDIVFHRELQNLGPADIPQIGALAKEAFAHIENVDQTSPHCRADVSWLALRRD